MKTYDITDTDIAVPTTDVTSTNCNTDIDISPPTVANDVINSTPTTSSNAMTNSTPSPNPKPCRELPTYIQDTAHAVRLFQDFWFPGPQHLIFTMDIQPLYTCIPHTDGLKALCFFLSHRPNQSPSTDTLICLTELVLTLKVSFNSSHFLQTKGVAMGTC
eukprot:g23653.t1